MMSKRKADGSLCEVNVVKVTSGEAVEVDYAFEWKIKNFMVIRSSNELIHEQYFDFEAGESHGCPTKWRCYLHDKSETKTIGMSLNLKVAPLRFKAIGNFTFQTIKPNGAISKWKSAVSKQFVLGDAWGFREMIPGDEKELEELIWKDGSIVIKVYLKLFLFELVGHAPPNKVDVQEEVTRFERAELQKLSQGMTRMMELGREQDAEKIIKVVSKDQVEFYVNTATLSTRSPVFQAMFESGNWRESQDSGTEGGGGPLVLEDLSGKTVKVLLHFLIGGVLLKDDWRAEDVIMELTYAADKYQLEGLTGFLDKVLPAINYGTEILAKLALLAKRLGMKNAERGLFAKVKETATDIEQMVLDKQGSLLGEN